jgi:glycosyltransferase involved in cell wall biosynthesis
MTPDSGGGILSIIIPAYNEEEAIAGTIQAALDARELIRAATGLDEVEVIVVSDGSSDRTVERVRAIADVKLIAYEKNRGYGAAIKTGYRASRGEILGFMDADGTCNSIFFADLITEMRKEDADIVLGSRLHPNSKMPRVRRIGNMFFAGLLSFLSGTRVRDSASGMRIQKRACLDWIDVLPDGLHFTPAMSAMACFNRNLRIAEIPMPYEERQGESKLNVLKDGLRFLGIIVGTAYTYLPFRFFFLAGLLALLAGGVLGTPILLDYARTGQIEAWQFYRIMTVVTLANLGLTSLMVGVLSSNFSRLILQDSGRPGKLSRFLSLSVMPYSWIVGIVFIAVAFVLVFPGLQSYVTTGQVTIHWSFVATALLFVGTGCNLILFFFMFKLQALLERKMEGLPNSFRMVKTQPPDLIFGEDVQGRKE